MFRAPEETKQKWQQAIESQKKSNLSIRAYCQREQIPEHRFHYWKKRLQSFGAPVPFIEITKQSPQITITQGPLSIAVEENCNPKLLKTLLTTMVKAC